MTALKAVMLNCTLKYAPEVSNTEALMLKVKEWWDTMDVETEVVRVTDFHVRFGVTSDEGHGDEWPRILEKVKAADIICIGTSATMARPDPPRASRRATVSRTRPAPTSTAATRAPSRARASAVARPIPRRLPAPVTRATRPARAWPGTGRRRVATGQRIPSAVAAVWSS
jgi:hypothetical protein